MKVIEISYNEKDLVLLKVFLDNLGNANNSFRYYNKRTLEVIKNHIITLLVIEKDFPIGYGHLDVDENTVWLGICVNPNYQKKGVGKLVMGKLIERAMELNISDIFLTVDIENKSAQILYEKFNFKQMEQSKSFCKYYLGLLNER